MLVIVILIVQIFFIIILGKECSYKDRQNAPEVFYINMDRSVDRNINMINHLKQLKLKFQRVRGIIPSEIYIPTDIQNTWQTKWCMLETEESIPHKSIVSANQSHILNGYNSIMLAMCGRNKKNTQKELGCVISHLVAMRTAIYSPTATSRYALIVEDDVYFPFDIDFDALALSAPTGFGILQLFNSNYPSMKRSFNSYVMNNELWSLRTMNNFDFWSTCAYLIDRVVMKNIVDKVIYEKNGWLNYKLIAGITSPCVPLECCVNRTNPNFNHQTPCVYAPRGYQADSFLYAMTKTFMLNVPLISNGKGGNHSTFHQDHVEMLHKNSFKQLRTFINDLLTKRVSPPNFAISACDNELLDVDSL